MTEIHLLNQISKERLWETNSALAQWPRHSGTETERAAFNYVQKRLDQYGLQTTLLEHPALISYPLESSLLMLDQAGNAITSYPCLGSAFSASVEALEAEVIDLGFGSHADYQNRQVAGKIVLLNGLATPTAVYEAEQAGAVGQIFINDDHLHYMIVSTIWGTPTPESAKRIPITPSVSITVKDGHHLRTRIAQGPVQVRIKNQIFIDWQQTPLLVAELPGRASADFVMFSGHLDAWEVGAMDNGSANATMLEVARLLSQHQDQLYRGLRLAFWSGHSHGRYSGSTWYADNFWEDLYDHCVAHVNVDSTGAGGATVYGNFLTHLELGALGAAVIQEQTGQQSTAQRMSRAGDMSFNGIGIPALFMTLSQVPLNEVETNYVTLSFGKLVGGKLPWWWHTSADTIDKVDLDVLALDTRIYLSTLWRLCHHPLLPMDFRPVIANMQQTVTQLQQAAQHHLDLSQTQVRLTQLAALVERLAESCTQVQHIEVDEAKIQNLNRQMKAFSRILIPVTYTASGPFDHDPAWELPNLPALSELKRLVQLDPQSDQYHFWRTQLVRNRNRINFALREAIAILATEP
jgi:hypothetical protein